MRQSRIATTIGLNCIALIRREREAIAENYYLFFSYGSTSPSLFLPLIKSHNIAIIMKGVAVAAAVAIKYIKSPPLLAVTAALFLLAIAS
jgi:hypothetical protein